MLERHILVRVHWLKALTILLSPILFLTILYFAISNRKFDQIFSIDNLIKITPSRPVPIIFVVCGFIFIGLIIREIIRLVSYKAAYLYIEDGHLKMGKSSIAELSEIDRHSVRIKKAGILRDLVLNMNDGSSKMIPLSFGKYDDDLILEDIISSIISAKKQSSAKGPGKRFSGGAGEEFRGHDT
jgi:hypothetical protein